MKIYKYCIRKHEMQHQSTSIGIPQGAQLLDIQYQPKQGIMLWAMVDEFEEDVDVHFKIFGTGQTLDAHASEEYVHLSTVQDKENGYVWHVFIEVGNQIIKAIKNDSFSK